MEIISRIHAWKSFHAFTHGSHFTHSRMEIISRIHAWKSFQAFTHGNHFKHSRMGSQFTHSRRVPTLDHHQPHLLSCLFLFQFSCRVRCQQQASNPSCSHLLPCVGDNEIYVWLKHWWREVFSFFFLFCRIFDLKSIGHLLLRHVVDSGTVDSTAEPTTCLVTDL